MEEHGKRQCFLSLDFPLFSRRPLLTFHPSLPTGRQMENCHLHTISARTYDWWIARNLDLAISVLLQFLGTWP